MHDMESAPDFDLDDLDDLAQRAGFGDANAFASLVRLTEMPLRRCVAAYSPNAEVTDEIVQATYITAWRRLRDYDQRGIFLAWLKGIARNLLRAEVRSRQRRLGVDVAELERLVLPDADLEIEDPFENVHEKLSRCLERLTPELRQLLDDRYSKARPLSDLAEILAVPMATLATRLFRVRQVLRQCLDGHVQVER
jgi:RNA polymerase sigma-70 factor, ECF subfamily